MSEEEKISLPMGRVRLLNESEAEMYRSMPAGITQDAKVIRYVAERDGKKRVLEITSSGYEIINVNM